MISLKYKFLFVHVPKTAGNSIQNILAPFADDVIVSSEPYQDGIERFDLRNDEFKTSKHSTLFEYRQRLGSRTVKGLFKFATIRNPWDMMISYYFSHHRGVSHWDKHGFKKLLGSVPTLRHYLCLPKSTLLQRFAPRDIFARIGPLDKDIDLLMRFEKLDEDFAEACRRIGLPSQDLPRRNASNRTDYRNYYDDECRELVRVKFSEEIEFGGYTFD